MRHRFDADDFGAEIAERHAARRAHDRVRKLRHDHAREGQFAQRPIESAM